MVSRSVNIASLGLVHSQILIDGMYSGGFARTALKDTPIAANGWYDHQNHQTQIRVYSQDSQRTVVESMFSGGSWKHEVKGITTYAAMALAAVELQNGTHHRVYIRNDSAAYEICRSKSDEWFAGEYYEKFVNRE